MLRINLLPKEVIERRRFEKWYGYVLLAGVVLLAFVGLVGLYFMFSAQAKNDELQQLSEKTSQLTEQANAFGIFEQKEQQLKQRESVSVTALAGRVNMGQIANEISLVLPDEVWVDQMIINQDAGLQLTSNTPRSTSKSMDVAYKSIAKTLVRLNELNDLYDVWLANASNTTWNKWPPLPEGSTGEQKEPVNTVSFLATGKVVKPQPAVVESSSVPAPPSTTGQ